MLHESRDASGSNLNVVVQKKYNLMVRSLKAAIYRPQKAQIGFQGNHTYLFVSTVVFIKPVKTVIAAGIIHNDHLNRRLRVPLELPGRDDHRPQVLCQQITAVPVW